jgi:hypothetical protein
MEGQHKVGLLSFEHAPEKIKIVHVHAEDLVLYRQGEVIKDSALQHLFFPSRSYAPVSDAYLTDHILIQIFLSMAIGQTLFLKGQLEGHLGGRGKINNLHSLGFEGPSYRQEKAAVVLESQEAESLFAFKLHDALPSLVL